MAIRATDDEVAVDVHSRGAVIPPERLDGIFTPTKAPQAPRKASARGATGSLGLGLHIAERIVSAHGGRIAVEPSEAHGTSFTVHRPRRG